MPNNSSKSKDFDFPRMITEFGGYISSIDKTNIAENFYVQGSQNIYKKLNGNLSVRQGQKRRGLADSTASPCSSEYVWNTSQGFTRTMVVSNSTLWVVIDDVWYALQTGLTSTRYVFDKWWDVDEEKDRLLFVNGTTNLYHWSGGYAVIASTTVNTITKTGTDSWKAAGFSDTSGEKKVMINGTEYTYTGGETTTTLTGVTPDPTGEGAGSAVLQSVLVSANTPTSTFNSDFLKIINNQVYLGSYTSLNIFMSSNVDFTNYVVPTPQLDGSPGLFVMPDTAKGIGVRQGNATVGAGSSNWVVISFELVSNNSIITRNNKIDIKPIARLQAPYAHEFIDNVGDTLVYLAQDQQVRALGDFNNLFVAGYPSYSQEISTELMAEDFTGGGLRSIGEFIYVTAPNSGRCYLRQERTRVDPNGTIVAERLWHSPFIWNATFIDQIDGDIVAFSNANPQIYDVWDTGQWYDDSPSDEELPYTSILAFGYRGEQRRQGLWNFDKLYTEGYIIPETELMCLMNYNYGGSTNALPFIINSPDLPAYTFVSNPASIGESTLGESIIGEGGSDTDLNTFPKFKTISSLPLINCFEYQPIYYSDTAGARWEILAIATNATVEENENAAYIINKLPLI